MRRTKAEALETREAILDAAENVFYEFGVNQSTLTQIARHAGVTRGAIYFHFRDKVDIFGAMLQRARFPQEDILEQADHNDHYDPLHVLHSSTISTLKLFSVDQRQQAIFTIIHHRCEYVGEMAEMLERLAETRKRVSRLFVQLLQRAKDRNMLAEAWSPESAAKILIAVVGGLLNEWLRNGKDFDLNHDGARTVTVIIDSFTRQ